MGLNKIKLKYVVTVSKLCAPSQDKGLVGQRLRVKIVFQHFFFYVGTPHKTFVLASLFYAGIVAFCDTRYRCICCHLSIATNHSQFNISSHQVVYSIIIYNTNKRINHKRWFVLLVNNFFVYRLLFAQESFSIPILFVE